LSIAELVRGAVDLGALKLPGGKTSGVEMVGLQTGRDAGLIEHDLKFRLLARDRFPADGARFAAAGSAEQEVLFTCSQMPIPDRCAGLISEQRFVRHRRREHKALALMQAREIARLFPEICRLGTYLIRSR
jgi:hypothetical protein